MRVSAPHDSGWKVEFALLDAVKPALPHVPGDYKWRIPQILVVPDGDSATGEEGSLQEAAVGAGRCGLEPGGVSQVVGRRAPGVVDHCISLAALSRYAVDSSGSRAAALSRSKVC